MAKSKTARLSLTMPGSARLSSDLIRSPGWEAGPKADSPRHSRRVDDAPTSKIPDEDICHTMASPGQRPAEPLQDFSSATSPRSVSPPILTPPISPRKFSSPSNPSSPSFSTKHVRENSKNFFTNLKASKSSHKIQAPVVVVATPTVVRKASHDTTNTSDDEMKQLKRAKSTPDIRGQISNPISIPDIPSLDSSYTEHVIPRRPVGAAASPSASANRLTSAGADPRITEPRVVAPAAESRSYHLSTSSPNLPPPSESSEPKKSSLFSSLMKKGRHDGAHSSQPATPMDATFSGTRESSRERSRRRHPSPQNGSDHEERASSRNQNSQSFREGGGSNFFSSIKSTTAKATGGINKAGNRLFAKTTKSAAPSSYVPPQQENEFSRPFHPVLLNLPLVEQTRVTRIAKRLEMSRDKTEFWMPALPWRSIDFLNFHGTELEGLYRVPGSSRMVGQYLRRFDQEGDIDLFKQDDLHDPNIIGSLFKQWLRDLDDQIFPKGLQESVTEEHGEGVLIPDSLKNALSSLPPWNYYLLFAITCHLSLLYAHRESNKMGYQNLVVCFLPALKLNGNCFKWLVLEWRLVWQGTKCLSEDDAIAREYAILDAIDYPENGGTTPVEAPIAHPAEMEEPVVDDQLDETTYSDTHQSSNRASHSRNLSQLPVMKPLSPMFMEEDSRS